MYELGGKKGLTVGPARGPRKRTGGVAAPRFAVRQKKRKEIAGKFPSERNRKVRGLVVAKGKGQKKKPSNNGRARKHQSKMQ